MVVWDYENQEYVAKEKINDQTIEMRFQLVDDDGDIESDTIYVNVALSVYSKRKHKDINENNCIITGNHPLETFAVARRMFKDLQKETLIGFLDNYNVIIYAHWVDNRRRDVYYKALHKMGYDYGNLFRKKVIMQSFKKGDWREYYAS